MASQDLKLNHIVLDDDDDDEIVIQAGIPSSPVVSAPVYSYEEDEPADAEIQSESEEAVEYDAPAAAPVAPVRVPARDDREEQTSDDLKMDPMPFAQKATLLGAAFLIVAAVAYYLLLMN